jgi:hypothetical protein
MYVSVRKDGKAWLDEHHLLKSSKKPLQIISSLCKYHVRLTFRFTVLFCRNTMYIYLADFHKSVESHQCNQDPDYGCKTLPN